MAANADILFELGRKTLQNDVSRSKSCILLIHVLYFILLTIHYVKNIAEIAEKNIVMKTKQKKYDKIVRK